MLDREQEIAKEALKTGDKVCTCDSSLEHCSPVQLSAYAPATSIDGSAAAQVSRGITDKDGRTATDATRARTFPAVHLHCYSMSLLRKAVRDPKLTHLQVASIEFTQIQATVMKGLEMGNDVLKELHKEVSLERVERLMDKTRDGVEYQRVRLSVSPLHS